MSRIGRHPIAIPAGVTVTVSDDNHVVVKGPKGQLEQTVNKNITVKVEGNEVHVTRPNDEKQNRAFHGLYRALIANMVVGVTEGYKKTLALVHWLSRRGEGRHPEHHHRLQPSRHYEGAAEHFLCYAEPDDHRGLRGIDKQQVGNVAADIRAVRSPEPYHGKGIRYADEVVRQKEGKTGKK